MVDFLPGYLRSLRLVHVVFNHPYCVHLIVHSGGVCHPPLLGAEICSHHRRDYRKSVILSKIVTLTISVAITLITGEIPEFSSGTAGDVTAATGCPCAMCDGGGVEYALSRSSFCVGGGSSQPIWTVLKDSPHGTVLLVTCNIHLDRRFLLAW